MISAARLFGSFLAARALFHVLRAALAVCREHEAKLAGDAPPQNAR